MPDNLPLDSNIPITSVWPSIAISDLGVVRVYTNSLRILSLNGPASYLLNGNRTSLYVSRVLAPAFSTFTPGLFITIITFIVIGSDEHSVPLILLTISLAVKGVSSVTLSFNSAPVLSFQFHVYDASFLPT